ncbi:MAG TPA: hypothetical protein P5195_04480 [Anaerolineae bacterium]|nr:hypothetical protein [Anaerolineae bacterium]
MPEHIYRFYRGENSRPYSNLDGILTIQRYPLLEWTTVMGQKDIALNLIYDALLRIGRGTKTADDVEAARDAALRHYRHVSEVLVAPLPSAGGEIHISKILAIIGIADDCGEDYTLLAGETA